MLLRLCCLLFIIVDSYILLVFFCKLIYAQYEAKILLLLLLHTSFSEAATGDVLKERCS